MSNEIQLTYMSINNSGQRKIKNYMKRARERERVREGEKERGRNVYEY